MSNKLTGDTGEIEVCEKVPCPNCGKALMCLPSGYPLYDVQCTGCLFRAQVKTNNARPKREIYGATWEIVNKVLKAGYTIPPLIVNFRWVEETELKREIRFYPFVPKTNLRPYIAKFKSDRKDLKMFNYMNIDKLPHFVLYKTS